MNDKARLINLGAKLGRHQSFALIANRCSAADAEALKAIRDSGEYKELGITWDEFCVQHAGMSRPHADRHILCFEEFGENYRRFAEIMGISPVTYKLIGGAVSDEGITINGECIPLTPENRPRIAAAVKTLRTQTKMRKTPIVTPDSLNKGLEKLIAGIIGVANEPGKRAEIIVLVERAGERLQSLAQAMRERTVLVE
jgi:hypothetical protein